VKEVGFSLFKKKRVNDQRQASIIEGLRNDVRDEQRDVDQKGDYSTNRSIIIYNKMIKIYLQF